VAHIRKPNDRVVTVPDTPDTLMTVTSRRFFTERKRIVEFAGKYRLPAIYFQKEFVDEGGLMSYGVDFGDQFRKAAH
jgi:putative ABC transport system substrate-binding protein